MKQARHKGYIRRTEKNIPATTTSSSAADIMSPRFYPDLRLPLSVFIECLVDKQYSGLVISGKANEDEIEAAWRIIFNLYAEEAGGEQYNEIFIKTKSVNVTSTKIYIIECTVATMKLMYDQRGADILNSYALRCDVAPDDDYETRCVKLDGLLMRSRKFNVQLDKLQKELKEVSKEAEEKTSESDYFDDMLNFLSETNGYMIKANDITVSRFLKMLKKLTQKQRKERSKITS
jgi:hypothetical protein